MIDYLTHRFHLDNVCILLPKHYMKFISYKLQTRYARPFLRCILKCLDETFLDLETDAGGDPLLHETWIIFYFLKILLDIHAII